MNFGDAGDALGSCRWLPAARHAAVIVLLAALSFGAVAIYHPPALWQSGIDTADWDQRFTAAQLWWLRSTILSGNWNRLADPPFFHPADNALAAVTHIYALGVLSLPFHALPPLAAHRALNILMMTLAGWGMWMLVRRLTGSHAAGLVAGALFALGPHSILSLNRPHIMTPFPWPFLLLALESHRRRPALRSAIGIAAALIVCFWIDWYIVLFTGILVACWLAALALCLPVKRFLRQAAAIGAAGVLAALTILPVYRIYAAQNEHVYFHADVALRQRFLPWHTIIPSGQTIAGRLARAAHLPVPRENPAYIGLSACLLAPVAAWTLLRRKCPRRIARLLRRHPPAVFAVLMTCGGILLMAGPRIHVAGRDITMPMTWIGWLVDGLKFSRSPWRYEVLAVFGLALLAAFGLAWLLARARRTRWRALVPAIGAAAILLAMADVVPLVRKNYAILEDGPLLDRLRDRTDIRALAEVPVDGAGDATAAMLRVTRHRIRVHHGYTDINYPGCVNVEDFLSLWPEPVARAALEYSRLDALLVRKAALDPAKMGDGAAGWRTLDEDDRFLLVAPAGPPDAEAQALLDLLQSPSAEPPTPIVFEADQLLTLWRDNIQIDGARFRTGIDPVMAIVFDPPFDPAVHRKVIVRVRLERGPASPERTQLFWRGPQFPHEIERRSAVEPLFISRDWSEAVFDFTHDPRWVWSGPITTLRWDITANSNYIGELGSVRIE